MRRSNSVRRATCSSSPLRTPAAGSGQATPGCNRPPRCLRNRGAPHCGTRRSCRRPPSVVC
eukprot:9324225-Pyramimonas_sp.AAC.1